MSSAWATSAALAVWAGSSLDLTADLGGVMFR